MKILRVFFVKIDSINIAIHKFYKLSQTNKKEKIFLMIFFIIKTKLRLLTNKYSTIFTIS